MEISLHVITLAFANYLHVAETKVRSRGIYDEPLGGVYWRVLYSAYDERQNLGMNLHDLTHFRESMYY